MGNGGYERTIIVAEIARLSVKDNCSGSRQTFGQGFLSTETRNSCRIALPRNLYPCRIRVGANERLSIAYGWYHKPLNLTKLKVMKRHNYNCKERVVSTVPSWTVIGGWLMTSWMVVCTTMVLNAAESVIVVRPAGWSEAIQSWRDYRESQGYQVIELDTAATSEEVQQSIRQAAEKRSVAAVLLACDVGRLNDGQPGVSACYHRSRALVRFGGDETIASDNDYGDLDGDHVPELAVGRVPADSSAQLAEALARSIAYERNRDSTLWRRDIHVVAGVGGFGALADGAIEMTTRQFLSQRIPGWAELSMTQASPRSFYCPDPWKFSQTAIGRMNQGGMLWVYIGHGHVKTLDYLQCNQEWLPIMTNEHLTQVDVGQRPPIAIFLACYTGAFDALEDSLAERLVLLPNGPIAALAASRVSGPYGMAMLSNGLLSESFQQQTPTLGHIILNAKRSAIKPIEKADGADAKSLQMINSVATALTPDGYDLAAERQEHVWMMNLLGDPLLRLSHPEEIQLEAVDECAPGQPLEVRGHCPKAGTMRLELAYRRDQVKPNLQVRDAFQSDVESRQRTQQQYELANTHVIEHLTQTLAQGPFVSQLKVPADLPRGKYSVRAFLDSQGHWAVGYRLVSIRPVDR